jgi:hypothetical protein
LWAVFLIFPGLALALRTGLVWGAGIGNVMLGTAGLIELLRLFSGFRNSLFTPASTNVDDDIDSLVIFSLIISKSFCVLSLTPAVEDSISSILDSMAAILDSMAAILLQLSDWTDMNCSFLS